MRRITTRALIAYCAMAFLCVTSAVSADLHCDFEASQGHNAEPIADKIAGMTFTSASGEGVRFADINSGWYSATSDNGKVFEDGEYFVSGNVAAFIPSLGDTASVTFTCGTASYFTVGYSSQFQFFVEAYDVAGSLLNSATGPANTKSLGGAGLSYLTVTHPNIAYVTLHDQGGYWMVDNIVTDAPVPEPGSILALLMGLGGLAASRRRMSR